MNIVVLKQITILSALLGVGLALLALIPFVGTFAFFALLCLVSVFVFVILTRVKVLNLISVHKSVMLGGFIGFVSFFAFAVVYLPIVAILGQFVTLYSEILQSLVIMLKVANFWMIFLLTIFVAILSAITNAFSGFVTYYVLEFLKTLDKNENDEFKL